MENRLICPKCKCHIEKGRCTVCNKVYFDLKNDIYDFENGYKSKIEEKYDELNVRKKENLEGHFSFFLNMGYSNKKSRDLGVQKNSLELLKKLIENIVIEKKNILEVGCGRGGNLFYLANCGVSNLVGLDLTKSSILFCKSKGKPIFFVRANAESIPFETNSFEILLNIESSLHYENIYVFFMEAYRVLKKEGIFLYADFVITEKMKKYIEDLKKIGFKILDVEDITLEVLESMKKNLSWDVRNPIFEHKNTYQKLKSGFLKYIIIKGIK